MRSTRPQLFPINFLGNFEQNSSTHSAGPAKGNTNYVEKLSEINKLKIGLWILTPFLAI